jgi:hypothetical protein
MKEYKRNCPICDKELIHIHYVSFRTSLKNNKPCSKCANTERANRPDIRRANSERQLGKRIGEDNPFYGKTHSDETKKLIRTKRANQIMPIGKDNKLFGKKLEEIVGTQKANQIKSNKSKKYKGSGNPMFGKLPAHGSGNGWSGWYNGWFFRSILELSYMIKVIERYGMVWESGENGKYTITYTTMNGIVKNYHPDFIINNKYMVEIKPTPLIKTIKVIEKTNAGIDYCNKNNMIYKITNIPSLTTDEFRQLIDTNKIQLTKRYKQKYINEYKD